MQCVTVAFPDHTQLFYDNHDHLDVLVLGVYWVLTESKILIKPMLGGVRIATLYISSHEQT